MIAYKCILAVILVISVDLAQVNGRPADTDWAAPFEDTLKNLTSSINGLVGDNGHKVSDFAKASYSEFLDKFNNGLNTLSKTFEGKTNVSEAVKEATKQWQTAVETYSKKLPEDLTPAKLNEKFEKSLKYITDNATELSKKAKGNTEIEKDIREFTKSQIDGLLKQVESLKNQFIENKS